MATRNLKKGCTGSDVKTLQKQLKQLGYYSGSIDGSFGSITDAAVRKFQKASGLKVDGIVGSKTRAALAGKTKKKTGTTVKKNSTNKNTKSKSTAHNIGKWNGHKFVVSSKMIRSFEGLQIKGSSELKSAKDSGQGKVARKGANPTEVSLTVKLNAYVGCDVKKEAMALVSEARSGKKGYFYIGKKKLLSCKLMLTEATVKEVEVNSSAKWINAEVSLTLKQCNKGGSSSSSSSSSSGSSGGSGGSSGSGSGGSGGSNKASVRTSSPTTKAKIAGAAAAVAAGVKKNSQVDAVSGAAPTAKSVKAGTSAVTRIATNAKKTTVATKIAGAALTIAKTFAKKK